MDKNTIPPPAKCYCWDYETMIYQGEILAYASPLDWQQGKLEYILPAESTFCTPPAPLAGQIIIRRGDHWSQVPDCRGKIYYDTITKARHEIKTAGEQPEDHWTEQEPPDISAEWTEGAWVIPFPILQDRKKREIRQETDAKLAAIQSGYSQSEIISWSKQEAGARALTEDAAATTPDAEFVRVMATTRGIPVMELVGKIMGNLSPYAEQMALALGMQQRREDMVPRATTPEELEEI